MINEICVILGAVIIIVYISPLIKSKINIGNAFGVFVGLCLILFGFFKDYLFSNPFTAKLTIIAVICFLILMAVFTAILLAIAFKSRKTAENESVVIVLGCRVKGDKPSRALAQRCRVAVNHLKQNESAVAILSGGQGADEKISEAECMKRIFLESGIDEKRLFTEDKSTSTQENIIYSKEIIKKNGLSKNVAIATNEYHIFRSLRLAECYGLSAKALPAKSIPILRTAYYTREVFGVCYMLLKKNKLKNGD